jgi:hypothetical protein
MTFQELPYNHIDALRLMRFWRQQYSRVNIEHSSAPRLLKDSILKSYNESYFKASRTNKITYYKSFEERLYRLIQAGIFFLPIEIGETHNLVNRVNFSFGKDSLSKAVTSLRFSNIRLPNWNENIDTVINNEDIIYLLENSEINEQNLLNLLISATKRNLPNTKECLDFHWKLYQHAPECVFTISIQKTRRQHDNIKISWTYKGTAMSNSQLTLS